MVYRALLPHHFAPSVEPGATERSAQQRRRSAASTCSYASLLDGRTLGGYEPASVAADWRDLCAFGRGLDFRPRRFFGRPRPI
jgi:hypothetical protein